MLTAFVIAFLALRLLVTSPNLSSASPYQNALDDNNILDDSLLDDVDQAGIDRSDLEDQPEDGRQSNREEYSMAVEEPEAPLSQEPAEPEELEMPMEKGDDRKEKRWIWSRKSKKENKNNWVFNTGATEGARGTALPQDEHVRNRAAEIYGNQYDKGVNQVSRSV